MIYRIFKTWILFAFLAAGTCGLVYLAIQQSLRMGANDPQIQMAEDYVTALGNNPAAGTDMRATAYLPPNTISGINIATSLSPYFAFFDADGNPVSSTGFLTENTPLRLPQSIFSNPRLKSYGDEIRFTWQPAPGIRQAVVLIKAQNSFVMVGRSLREVEIRESQALHEAAAAWLAIVIGIFILQLLLAIFEKRTK